MSRSLFRKDWRNFPVFCLVEPPEQYWNDLVPACEDEEDDESLVQICSNAPDRDEVITHILKGSSDNKFPFRDSTVSDCYQFFKKYLRPDETAIKRGPFTSFTFIVIDQAGVEHEPPQCLICCDAPDYGDQSEGSGGEEEGEGVIELRTEYVPLADAFNAAIRMEELLMTMSELRGQHGIDDNGDLTTLSCYPPFTEKKPPPGSPPASPDEYLVCTPAEARANKRRALACERPNAMKISIVDQAYGRKYYLVSPAESLSLAILHSGPEYVAGQRGCHIIHRDDLTEEEKENRPERIWKLV